MSGWRTGAGANGRGVTQGPTGCTAPHEAVTERWLALKMEQEQVRGQGRGQEQEQEQESVAMSEASVAMHLVHLSGGGSVNLTDEQALRAYRALGRPCRALHGGGDGVAPPPSTSANQGPSGTDDRESDASVAQPSGGASGGVGGVAPLTRSQRKNQEARKKRGRARAEAAQAAAVATASYSTWCTDYGEDELDKLRAPNFLFFSFLLIFLGTRDQRCWRRDHAG